jgi:hypothetical protein
LAGTSIARRTRAVLRPVKREHRGPKLGFFSWEKTDKAEALKKLV